MRPLAVTGVGVVCPIGTGRDEFAKSLSDPTSARERAFGQKATTLDPEKAPNARVAEVWGFDPAAHLGDKGLRNLDRLTKMLIVAGKLALEDAGIKKDGEFVALSPERVGICSSTAYGSLDAITELNLVAELEDPRYINPARFPNTVINAAAGYVSIWEDLRAPNVTIVDGNCGALDAVLTCETNFVHRRGDCFLVGGGEPLTEPLYVAFRRLGIVAESDESPGLSFGEGAALLCVEREEDAARRGAHVRARILGYGTAFEPPLSPAALVHASADPVQRAILAALADAELSPSDVDLVCSAVSGVEAMDHAERTGIAAALGHDVAIAAPKTMWGETFGGAGALGMAASVAWLEGVKVGPVIAGRGPEAPPRVVVVTALGFYGNVSAVVLGGAE